MLIIMCSCAPEYFCVDLFSIFRVIALDLVKICTLDFACGFFKVLLELLPLTYSGINLQFSTCSCIAQEVFDL
jgi:hypothetical protein